jgi:nitroreductase
MHIKYMSKKNEILEAVKYRRAIKVFEKDKIISKEDFDFILEVGRLSPSSFGWEPWQFLVVQNQDIRGKLSEFSWGAEKQLASASHFVVLLARKADDMRPGSEYLSYISKEVDNLPAEIEEMKIGFFKNFQENEFDLTDDRKLFDWASKQVYIPMANMMTAAAQINIDSCPIEGFDRLKAEELLKKEGIVDTDHFGVAAMVAFGYRSENSPYPNTRQTIDKVVKWV